MTAVACACAAVAALLWFPVQRPLHVRLAARPAGLATVAVRGRSVAMAAAAALATLCAGYLFGPRWAAVTLSAVVVVGTAIRLAVLEGASRAALRAAEATAQACNVLASQVRIGRVATQALHVAAQDCPLLGEADSVQRLGGDVAAVWRAAASRPGHRGLLRLARAWHLSAVTGAPLAPALDRVAEALRADLEVRAVVAAELATSRATGRLMAVLPFCGLGLGFLIGGDPLQFLLSAPYGWACLVLGVSLASVGVLWIDRLARSTDHW
jgi:tight adherence protein B